MQNVLSQGHGSAGASPYGRSGCIEFLRAAGTDSRADFRRKVLNPKHLRFAEGVRQRVNKSAVGVRRPVLRSTAEGGRDAEG